jgi:dTMP kinase
MSGRFITFEGIDGAGKSTHIPWFAQRLRERGVDVVVTREPGGTRLAEKLRELLLHEPMSVEAETLLMFAARREHLDGLIRPALARGAWVVCDRFTDSTFAYQGGGRGVPLRYIEALESWVHADLQPHRSYLFDLPAALAAQRRAAARDADRFEAEDLAFFERVRGSYLQRVRAQPSRFVLVDSTQPITDVKKLLEESIASI